MWYVFQLMYKVVRKHTCVGLDGGCSSGGTAANGKRQTAGDDVWTMNDARTAVRMNRLKNAAAGR